ncbi:uncharacterized protein [Choristoneura fumiferana]|uniref:uncharacterized protein n=1 Tax=Choristoneura fumiferana TaxID=7141 RepID=UPI003D15705C
MVKTIKSGVRELIFKMITHFQNVKEEMESVREQKEQCLHKILTSTRELSEAVQTTIKNSVDKLKQMDKLDVSAEATYIQKISSMTGISLRTIRQIKHEGNTNSGIWVTPGKKRKCRATKRNIDDFDKVAIRNLINEFYLVRNEVPTIAKLLSELRQSIQFDGGHETLRKILHDMGFCFKKNVEERTILMEKNDIAAARHKYIRKITEYRNMPSEERKPIVYLDETYIHVNYKPKKSWQGPSTSKMVTNISKGKRFIIVHAGTESGFVNNALLIFSSKSKSADYHDDMNAANFSKWVQDKLLPNLDTPSIIVMDNASYHTIQINKAPNTSSRKQAIRDWLTSNNFPWEETFTRAELLTLVKRNKPDPIYYIDELLKANGHEVLRLPPYHCHLNTIELIWSMAKRKVGSVNVKGSARDMEAKVEQAFASVSPDDWHKCAEHVKKLESEHRQQDGLLDDLIPFVINVQSDDDTDSGESRKQRLKEKKSPKEFRYRKKCMREWNF